MIKSKRIVLLTFSPLSGRFALSNFGEFNSLEEAEEFAAGRIKVSSYVVAEEIVSVGLDEKEEVTYKHLGKIHKPGQPE